MSETPRTDEVAHLGYQLADLAARLCDLSRTLERELNQLRAEVARLTRDLKSQTTARKDMDRVAGEWAIRAEKADAEVARLTARLDQHFARAEKADAEVARLREENEVLMRGILGAPQAIADELERRKAALAGEGNK